MHYFTMAAFERLLDKSGKPQHMFVVVLGPASQQQGEGGIRLLIITFFSFDNLQLKNFYLEEVETLFSIV